MWDLTLPARAKINLGLEIVGKRADGYHELRTIFQELEFHDTLNFSAHAEKLAITTDHPSLPTGDQNLIYRAAQLLHRKTGCAENVAIHLEKRIPLGAGLGGGSSDAAATLLGMNQLYSLGCTTEELASFGAELGSDVAFFLYGGTALAAGRGEEIHPLPDIPPCWVVLVYPGIHVSSAWAYKNVNLKLTKNGGINSVRLQHSISVITGEQGVSFVNMLEEPVIREYPVINSIKMQLLDYGAEGALMSGSGSTVFGIFQEKDFAEKVRQQMERPDWFVVATGTHSGQR